jgi:hypothetical protein
MRAMQAVRYARRQDRGLGLRLIVVRVEIDGLFVDVRQQLAREPRHAHFGVAHGRRRIAVHRPEISLAVHQQVAHRKRLGHAHDGVVHGRIAVRMVFADHIADHTRTLLVGAVEIVAQLAHGVEHPPVHGLQAVAHVGQRAPHDHAHGVIQVRLAHLVFEIYGQYFACDLGHLRESGKPLRADLCGFVGGETRSQHGRILAHFGCGPSLDRALADILRTCPLSLST